MPESKINEVAQKLLDQSEEHKVNWEDAGKIGSYRVFFPDVVLAISQVYLTLEEPEEIPDFRLELMGETGRVIEFLQTAPGEPMYLVLSEIFNLASQQIRDLGITKALEYLGKT